MSIVDDAVSVWSNSLVKRLLGNGLLHGSHRFGNIRFVFDEVQRVSGVAVVPFVPGGGEREDGGR